MNTITIELLLFLLLVLSVGAYYIGKNRHILLLKALGLKSAFIMTIVLIFYSLLMIKQEMS